MHRLALTVCLAAILGSCSADRNSSAETATAESAENLFGAADFKTKTNDSTAVKSMKWDKNGTEFTYNRVGRHVSTPDTAVYLDIICDYLPGNQEFITTAAKAIDCATLTVRGLEKSNLPESDFQGPDAIEKTVKAIANDFTSRVYPELAADTAMYYIAQTGVVKYLIAYATPKVLTVSNYNEFYLCGAAHGMYDCTLTTYDRADNRPLGLDELIKPGQIGHIRSLLLDKMAQANGYASVTEYLSSLKDWINAQSLTPSTFPIYNAGLTEEGLTFIYPLYSIAPYSSGLQIFTLPYSQIKDDINYQ